MRIGTARTTPGTRVVVQDEGAPRLTDHPTVRAAIRAGLSTEPTAREGTAVKDINSLNLAAAVTDPAKVICVGHEYAGHIRAMGHKPPTHPNLFTKFAEALTGPTDGLPLDHVSEAWDWEAVLALIITHPVRRADREQARAAIAGYTVAKDVSAGDWQHRASQFPAGKTCEATNPVGPWIVTANVIDPADGLAIICPVDDAQMQQASIVDLAFQATDLVASASQIVTRQTGDVILTGTPSGVGAAVDPPRWLAPGEVLYTAIEGLGGCQNTRIEAGFNPSEQV